jgi:predicted porin
MQKKLLTVAVASALAVPAVAFADVTVYGTIDTGIRNISKIVTATGTGSLLDVANNTRTTNRWGLKGSEDLGGGLKANFTLEGQYASDSGGGPGSAAGVGNQGLFQRKSIVGLAKGGNSVDLGRDYTVNFKAQGIYDPMSYTYTGITPAAGGNTAGVRSSNMVTAGFRFGTGGVRVDYALGEVVAQSSWGTRTGFMGDFAFGPVTITGAYSSMKDAATGNITTKTTNFGGKYAMGAFTFRAGWSQTDVDAGNKTPLLMFGVQYAMSPTLNGRVGYYSGKTENAAGAEVATSKLTIVALDYSLSKSTVLYVEFDRKGLTGTAASTAVGAQADGSTGLGVGVMHAF